MSEPSAARQVRPADPKRRLNLAAATIVFAGAVLLAGAAFVLSYARFHEMALNAGVSPSFAALYPLMFDTTLVIACAAALTLRGATWWMRGYAFLSITILLAGVAAAEAVHSAGISLPYGPTAATFAALPWALFLVGFSLGLLVLRYFRTTRAMARADEAGVAREPVNKPDASAVSVFQPAPASQNLGQHPVAPAAVSTPASEHRQAQVHWRPRRADRADDS